MATRMQPGRLRAAGYVRVSRVNGRDGAAFQSPGQQRESIAGQARAHGFDLVRVIEDLDESGGDLDRPGFRELTGRVEAGELDAVIVYDLSRLSREMVDMEETAAYFANRGVAMIDPTTPPGSEPITATFMRQALTAVHQLERARKRERFNVSRKNAVERGVYPTSVAPMGYSFDEGHRLIPNEQAAAVTAAFHMRAAGASWAELQAHIRELCGRECPPSMLAKVLRNRAYLGEARSGEYVKVDAHAPLIDATTFDLANRKQGTRHRSGTKTLLTGIARCGTCGGRLTSAANGNGYSTYRCSRVSAKGYCPAPVTIGREALDAYVIDELFAWANESGDADRGVEVPGDSALASAELAVRMAERDLEAFVTAAGVARLSPALQAKGMAVRQTLLEDARSALEAARAADEAGTLRVTLRGLWPTLDTAERRELIAALIDRIPIARGRAPIAARVQLVWRDPA